MEQTGNKQQVWEAKNASASQIQKEILLKQLRENGFRVTKQRLMLMDIILEGGCASCKEIYYRALKQDPGIGKATVYRMVNTLEAMGAISRRNTYTLSVGQSEEERVCDIELTDNSVCQLSKEKWLDVVHAGLEVKGYLKNQGIRSIRLYGM